ncbi:D-2-hydroxyacid dehydrogenase [Candidatus Epulonipiscium viviparus]|uniref:D-2-hydroxyacid dehydrogenase n=1 Tax=Candidatus Epulonipiscium viviparus TaxID=420336 RepID=UPI0027380544|nr:D-2-hydroxyacid dehydrogenase [Candidatus Epulopiscium viviparus]
MKIVVLDGHMLNPGELSWEPLSKLGDLAVYDKTDFNNKAILERIGDATAVYTNKTPLDREVIEKSPNLKFIGLLATGYNIVDIDAAKENGIAVCNVPSYGSQAVGQFAIGLLLEICHHIGHHANEVKNGRWEADQKFCFWDFPLIELAGKTLGIIGFGRIGINTGKIAKAMGMKIIAVDNYETDEGKSIAEYVAMDTLLAKSDVISLHCPLFKETEGIICKENINKMKDGVIIINNSRGSLIVEEDLADALNSGKVYAAGLDVVCEEPVRANNPLLYAKNCIITPHISWAPIESRQRLLDIAVDNLQKFQNGNIVNCVNGIEK